MVPQAWAMGTEERDTTRNRRTSVALRQAADEVARISPDLLVFASPQWKSPSRYRIGGAPRYEGTMTGLLPHAGADQPPSHRRDDSPVPYDIPGDPEMAAHLLEAGEAAGLPVQLETRPEALDRSTMLPIMYLNPEGRIPLLPLSINEGPRAQSREWGEIIGRAISSAGRRAIFIASGTHADRFDFDSPDTGQPEEEKWDKHFMDRLLKGEPDALASLSNEEVTLAQLEAGGLHGLYMLLGALGTFPVASVPGYKGIVGIGSSIIRFEPAR